MTRRLRHLVPLAQPTAMLTLTCNTTRWPDPRLAYIAMNRAFPLLIKRLRRDHPGQPLEYFAVWETTRAGYPHLHVLLRAPYLPQRLISQYWQQIFASPIVDIRAVDSGARAAQYLAKYLTKALQAPRGFRRWRSSANFFPEPFRPAKNAPTTVGKVSIYRGTVHDVVWDWFSQGLWVRPLDDGTATAVYTHALDYAHATATDLYRQSLATAARPFIPP